MGELRDCIYTSHKAKDYTTEVPGDPKAMTQQAGRLRGLPSTVSGFWGEKRACLTAGASNLVHQKRGCLLSGEEGQWKGPSFIFTPSLFGQHTEPLLPPAHNL